MRMNREQQIDYLKQRLSDRKELDLENASDDLLRCCTLIEKSKERKEIEQCN